MTLTPVFALMTQSKKGSNSQQAFKLLATSQGLQQHCTEKRGMTGWPDTPLSSIQNHCELPVAAVCICCLHPLFFRLACELCVCTCRLPLKCPPDLPRQLPPKDFLDPILPERPIVPVVPDFKPTVRLYVHMCSGLV